MTNSLHAQEALRMSLANQANADLGRANAEARHYMFKIHDFRMTVIPSLNSEWNDNITSSKTNSLQDWIVSPRIRISGAYPVSQNNLLQLDLGFAYRQYIEHDRFSTWSLQSGSSISFDFGIKDVRINVHDNVSYAEDPSQEALIVDAATHDILKNTAGILATWNLAAVTLNLGYDHQNIVSNSRQFQSQDGTSDHLVGRAGFAVHPSLTAGVEATGSFTTHDKNTLNDSSSLSAGIYADYHPGRYFQVKPRVGFSEYFLQQNSLSIRTSDSLAWYADLQATHQVNDFLHYSLAIGREIALGIQSDLTEDWYVRPGFKWNFIRDVSLDTSFSFQHGKQGAGNVSGNLKESYNWSSGSIALGYAILKKLTASLSYRITSRTSTAANRDYIQNSVSLTLTYTPQ